MTDHADNITWIKAAYKDCETFAEYTIRQKKEWEKKEKHSNAEILLEINKITVAVKKVADILKPSN